MSERKIQDAILKLSGLHLVDTVSMIECRVSSVNKAERTCDVTAIGGQSDIDIPGVRLQTEVSDGLLILPKVDSTVFIGYSKRLAPFVLQLGDVDYVVIEAGDSTFEMSNDGKIRI